MAGPGQARFYSSTFVQTSLASGISSGATSFNVGTTTGAPGVPFVVSVDQNTPSEELMLVTNISGLQYTVTRGQGGTAAVAHANGASVVHVMYAQDLTDASIHEGSFDHVHGLSVNSLVVGTTDVQTLTDKTLTSPVINTPTITSPTVTGTLTASTINATGTITGANLTTAGTTSTGILTASGSATATDFAASGLTGATSASRYVGATSGGAPVSGTFNAGDFVIDMTNFTVLVCNSGGSPGTWSTLVNRTNTESLSNKTLSSVALSGAATGTASLILTNAIKGTTISSSGLTGATGASRYVGATSSGSPTSGTFATGDFVIDQTGIIWICTASGTPGTWVSASQLIGTGYLTNVLSSGGANRTAVQAPFNYSAQKTVTTAASGGWTAAFSDVTFHGMGSCAVTAGDNNNNLGFVSVIKANCNISAGTLNIGGQAFTNTAAIMGTGLSITLNFNISAW